MGVARAVDKKDCPICKGKMAIPVRLKGAVHGGPGCGCGSFGSYACLECVRAWLELNKPRNERSTRKKHLVCQKVFDPRGLNAVSAYVVDESLLAALDQLPGQGKYRCGCGMEFTQRVPYHAHMGDATCPLSTRKCPLCEARFQICGGLVPHVEECARNMQARVKQLEARVKELDVHGGVRVL